MGASLVVANAYHLSLRPGVETIRQLGGLHRVMAWQGPIMTDSGGFQLFSLSDLSRVDADGVTFRSHLDGSLRRLTPEGAIHLQAELGADIVTALDVCTPWPASRQRVESDVELTYTWARRSIAARQPGQLILGVVQGGTFEDLRIASAELMAELPFDGFAVGGLSVGEPADLRAAMLEAQVALLPAERPRHLLGVGLPHDFEPAVKSGIDTFDCVAPTRMARNGAALTSTGRINLRRSQYRVTLGPLEPDCQCYTCRHFDVGAVRHLLNSGEVLAIQLLTIHNLHFTIQMVRRLRKRLLAG
jgi:queuine tRNA-ribosyltransferase